MQLIQTLQIDPASIPMTFQDLVMRSSVSLSPDTDEKNIQRLNKLVSEYFEGRHTRPPASTSNVQIYRDDIGSVRIGVQQRLMRLRPSYRFANIVQFMAALKDHPKGMRGVCTVVGLGSGNFDQLSFDVLVLQLDKETGFLRIDKRKIYFPGSTMTSVMPIAGTCYLASRR